MFKWYDHIRFGLNLDQLNYIQHVMYKAREKGYTWNDNDLANVAILKVCEQLNIHAKGSDKVIPIMKQIEEKLK